MFICSCTRLRQALALCAVVAALAGTGCAGQLSHAIVNLRNAQGDAALENGNVLEAEKEYALALAMAPNDTHARDGLAHVLYLHAQANFLASKLDAASAEVQKALTYAPKDSATLDLGGEIEQAKIRRDIVIANYPSYQAMATSLVDALKAADLANKDIQKQLKAFRYDYDIAHLRKGIEQSYDLEAQTHRITQRLIAYRGLVESGAPGPKAPPAQSETPSLLPIP